MRHPKKLPPWSRHHEPWCAVFRDKPCDCEPPQRPPRRLPAAAGTETGTRGCLSAHNAFFR